MAITFNTSRHDTPPDSGGTTRPKEYDRDCIAAIFALVAEGATLTDACMSSPAFPSRSTVYSWIQEREDIRARYEVAKEFQREVYEDEVVSLIDNVKTADLVITVAPGVRVENLASARLAKATAQVKSRMWLLSKLSQRFREQPAQQGAYGGTGGADGIRHVIIRGALPDTPLGDLDDDAAAKLLAETAANYEFIPATPGGNPRRVGGKYGDFVVTGGLPRVPLGELPPEERAAAVREAAKTRTITREQITNPFGLDIAAIEAEDEAAERGLLNDPANYD